MSFKQKLALGLCTFYLFSVIGVALSMHFCGGKLASVAINSTKTECKFCKTEAPDKSDDGCCKNTKVEVKVKDSHQSQSSFKLPKLFSFEALAHVHVFERFVQASSFFRSKIENKAPPSPCHVARHVLNCVFRN
ncbi:MAG: hypothetical protein REI78_05675 [Pedobacter sp.]|nr:hypothetical protein [Pedobacter sp.]MDQ8052491.1 hypothetical protein [Pedobacter sp.]